MNFKVLAVVVEQFLTFVYWISYCQKTWSAKMTF